MGAAHKHFIMPVEYYEAVAKAEAADKARLAAMPKEQFEREMRLREVRAAERQSHKREDITIYNSWF